MKIDSVSLAKRVNPEVARLKQAVRGRKHHNSLIMCLKGQQKPIIEQYPSNLSLISTSK